MSNGNPEFTNEEFPEYEKFFQPIASALEETSRRHNLVIVKYDKEAPMWSLCFNHPRGGQAKIDVMKSENDKVGVIGSWHLDDFDKFCRSLKWGKLIEIDRNSNVLAEHVEKILSEICSWPLNQWTDVARGYQRYWGRYSKEEFEEMTPQWPEPKL